MTMTTRTMTVDTWRCTNDVDDGWQRRSYMMTTMTDKDDND
jgi:hypothetical protein